MTYDRGRITPKVFDAAISAMVEAAAGSFRKYVGVKGVEGKIIVVDDEKEIADLIEVYLRNEDYEVFKFYEAPAALECIEKNPVDLAILDVMLPEIDGFTICRKLRERYTYPVIMLTAKDEEVDKINGLMLGADDYITKPFRPMELIARVKAQLRRYRSYNTPVAAKASVIEIGRLTLNTETHQCTLDGEELSLTPTEFAILNILCERKGGVVSAEELFHQIWGDEYYTKSNNTITVHIRHLREKLKDSAEQSWLIKTVWGVGYKIETKGI